MSLIEVSSIEGSRREGFHCAYGIITKTLLNALLVLLEYAIFQGLLVEFPVGMIPCTQAKTFLELAVYW